MPKSSRACPSFPQGWHLGGEHRGANLPPRPLFPVKVVSHAVREGTDGSAPIGTAIPRQSQAHPRPRRRHDPRDQRRRRRRARHVGQGAHRAHPRPPRPPSPPCCLPTGPAPPPTLRGRRPTSCSARSLSATRGGRTAARTSTPVLSDCDDIAVRHLLGAAPAAAGDGGCCDQEELRGAMAAVQLEADSRRFRALPRQVRVLYARCRETAAEGGDVIVVFPGCKVPFVLRAAAGGYTLVCECYVACHDVRRGGGLEGCTREGVSCPIMARAQATAPQLHYKRLLERVRK